MSFDSPEQPTLFGPSEGKRCRCCKTFKPWSEFARCRTQKDGRLSYCRVCKKGMLADWLRRQHENKIASDGSGKRCNSCQVVKPFSDFGKHNGSGDGLHMTCKQCMSAYTRKNHARRKSIPELREKDLLNRRIQSLRDTYGLSLDDYNAMSKSQDDRCAICRRHETSTLKGALRSLAVDHDHKTGENRGLLCNSCNNGIGRFKEDPALLEQAAAYLRAYGKT